MISAIDYLGHRTRVSGGPLTEFAFGCVANADSILPSPNQFMYFQGGVSDVAFLSFMEVNRLVVEFAVAVTETPRRIRDALNLIG